MANQRTGMIVSSVAHAGVFAWAVIGLPSAAPYQIAPTEALPVEFITPSEYDQLTKGERHSKTVDKPKIEAKKIAAANPEPKPPAPEAKENVDAPPPPEQKVETPPEPPKEEPKKAEAPPPEPPKEEPKPEPKKAEATPTPSPTPKPADLPKPEKKVDQQSQAKLDDMIKKEVEKKPDPPKKVEKKTPDKPQPKFDPTKIAALADKRDPGRVAQAAPEISNLTTAGIASGTATQLSLSEKSMISQMVIDQVRQCWTPPIGAQGATDLNVVVGFQLLPDGSLTGEPMVMNRTGNPYFQSAADAATRAVRRCSPLKLPSQYYDHWKSVQINFDPREMMGG